MKTIILTLAAALIATQAFSQSVESCAKMDNDLDRLACYDKVSGRTPEVESLASRGAWNIQTRKSKLKDTTDVFLRVDSEEDVRCSFGSRGKVTLTLRCMENTTSAILTTPGCHMSSSRYNDYGHVDYRIDNKKSRVARMVDSTNNRSLGYWSGRRSIPFIKSMFGAKRILTRMTPYGENSFTVTFNISGLDEAIKPLRKSCSW